MPNMAEAGVEYALSATNFIVSGFFQAAFLLPKFF
jgi:hypothetical protein